MAKLFFRKVGDDTTNRRQVDVLNGVANIEFVDPETPYSLSLRHTGLWADEGVRNKDDYLYLNPSPANYNDRIQQANTPEVDGNVDLVWNKYPNYSAVSHWEKMKAVIAENRANGHLTNYDTVTTFTGGGAIPSGNDKYSASILTSDEKILIVPYNAAQPAIIDPITKTFMTFGISDTSLGKFVGAVLLPDNKILFIPGNAPQFCLVDPIALTTTPIGPINNNSFKYNNGVLLPDGRIFCSSRLESQAIIFDVFSETITNIGPIESFNSYFKSVLLPSGNLVLIPFLKSSATLVNPITQNFTSFGSLDSSIYKYYDGVLLSDERILNIPANTNRFSITDPIAQTITEIGPFLSDPNGGLYHACLLPDGRVFCSSRNAYNNIIIDPVTETIINIGSSDTAVNKFVSPILLSNGSIVIIPNAYTVFAIITASDGNYGALPDLDTCLSSYLNGF